MKITVSIFCCLLAFQGTSVYAQEVNYDVPPPIDIPNTPTEYSNPTINPYSPDRNYSQYINGDIGGDFYGFGNSNSSSCGVKVGVNPFKNLGDFIDMFSVSWNSKKCTDEEKIQKIKSASELERATIQQKTEVTTQAIKYCLEARQTAITHNQPPDSVCPLSFITEMKH